jgi:hypothetical protein
MTPSPAPPGPMGMTVAVNRDHPHNVPFAQNTSPSAKSVKSVYSVFSDKGGFGRQPSSGFGRQESGFGRQESGFGRQQSGFGRQESAFSRQFSRQESGPSPSPVKEITAETICRWKPDEHRDKDKFGWRCLNRCIQNSDTGKFNPFCAYHIKNCVAHHGPGTNSAIAVPNQYGLCTSHYISMHKKPPPELEFPFPNMDNPRQEKQTKSLTASHWAAPHDEELPKEPFVSAEYEPYDPPDDFVGILMENRRQQLYRRKRKKMGNWAATKIQAWYRRYLINRLHINVMHYRGIEQRHLAATIIQRRARGIQARKEVAAMRILYHRSVLRLQCVYRGNMVRRFLRDYFAACRLQKFMKRLHFFRFKDAVIMMMQLRTFFKVRYNHVVNIQRVWRGFFVRYDVFRDKLLAFIERRAIRIICKKCYKFALKLKRRRMVSNYSKRFAEISL